MLSKEYRPAAVKSCINNVSTSALYKKLFGYQVAVTDYSKLETDTPTAQDLYWMPGVGVHVETETIDCKFLYLQKGYTVTELKSQFNSLNGILYAQLHFSNGQQVTFGQVPTSTPVIGTNNEQNFQFTDEKPLIGFWGWQTTDEIEALGVISLDTAKCPDPPKNNGQTTSGTSSSDSISSSSDDSGLTGGEIAAIVICVILFVILVILCIVFSVIGLLTVLGGGGGATYYLRKKSGAKGQDDKSEMPLS